MSGSGKPGKTFKAKVLAASLTTATIEAEREDIAYLVPGTEYVFSVLTSTGRNEPGSVKPAAESDD